MPNAPCAVVIALALAAAACTETFDAGRSSPHGKLPVDQRNPIVILNDHNADNWQGEYAVLLSNSGGPELVGIIIVTSPPWPDINANIVPWRNLVQAARQGGLTIPDPRPSLGGKLQRPASGVIDATQPNGSDGALFIVHESARLSLPYRPLVVVTGGPLTDVADAYLIDHSVTDRVVIVAALGRANATGASMGLPNGEMDPWADTIVTARFQYVQVSAYYDQLTDVPASSVINLPHNAFGDWIAAKQPDIWNDSLAADQVAVAAVGIPDFVVDIRHAAPVGPSEAGAKVGPDLADNSNASGWLVHQCNNAAATAKFWNLLNDPTTFAH
jgi:hypothetical protein